MRRRGIIWRSRCQCHEHGQCSYRRLIASAESSEIFWARLAADQLNDDGKFSDCSMTSRAPIVINIYQCSVCCIASTRISATRQKISHGAVYFGGFSLHETCRVWSCLLLEYSCYLPIARELLEWHLFKDLIHPLQWLVKLCSWQLESHWTVHRKLVNNWARLARQSNDGEEKLFLLSRSIVPTIEQRIIITDFNRFSGISSVVRRCIDKETGKEYAAKIIDIGAADANDPQQMLEATRQEINILRQVMGHAYISELREVCRDERIVTFSLSLFSWAPRCVWIWCVHLFGVWAVSSRRALRLPHVGRHVIREEDSLHHETDFWGRWLHSLSQHRSQRLEAREHSSRRQFERQDHRLRLCKTPPRGSKALRWVKSVIRSRALSLTSSRVSSALESSTWHHNHFFRFMRHARLFGARNT